MDTSKCKRCRRLGVKLFLRGDRCVSPKCAMIKRAYPPEKKGKRRNSRLSEYAEELRDKQILRAWYHLSETQFRKYVKSVLKKQHKVEDAASLLVKILESRLDNTVFRLGFAVSRAQARQQVTYGHFLVNNKSIDVPSFMVKKGDKISLKPVSVKKASFQNIKDYLKKYKTPAWVKLNAEQMEGEIVGEPTLEEAAPPVEISSIFEFYSR